MINGVIGGFFCFNGVETVGGVAMWTVMWMDDQSRAYGANGIYPRLKIITQCEAVDIARRSVATGLGLVCIGRSMVGVMDVACYYLEKRKQASDNLVTKALYLMVWVVNKIIRMITVASMYWFLAPVMMDALIRAGVMGLLLGCEK